MALSEPPPDIFEFGSLRLDVRDRRLFKAGTVVQLTPKTFDLFRILIENKGRVVRRAELLEALWPDVQVEEGNLSFQVATLRKALGPEVARSIETVPRYGYRFNAELIHAASQEGSALRDTGRIKEVCHPPLLEAVPSPQSTDLNTAEDLWRVPAPRTQLIGRDRELAAADRLLLTDNVRLFTITGPGGCGKTRLALQMAADNAGKFAGGIHFLSLLRLVDPAMVPSALARVFGLRHTGGKPMAEALYDHLERTVHARTLLIVDNFEHLLPAAPVLGTLLEHCRSLRMVVTSRAVLRIYGESEFPLAGLVTPDPQRIASLEELQAIPAVTLFVQRAVAVDPGFELTDANAAAVARICTRLDGLPLAIELAAARTRLLSAPAILAKLEEGPGLLVGGARDLHWRHQTIRGTVEWSYGLLTGPEQKLLRRLCVFAGGCTLESAEAVCNAREDLGLEMLEGISSLVGQSMLQRNEVGGEFRFSLLEIIREYGLERLAESGEEEDTRRAHAAYCLVLAKEGEPAADLQQTDWLSRCEDNLHNLHGALDWLIRRNSKWAMPLGIALFPFWERREHFSEGRSYLKEILGLKDPRAHPRGRAAVAASAGSLAGSLGDWEDCDCMHREALAIYQQLDDRIGVATQFNLLGINQLVRGNCQEAEHLLQHSLSAWRELGDRAVIARVLSNLAAAVNLAGDHERARTLLEESRSLFHGIGDEVGTAWCLTYLGDVARDTGDTTAFSLYREAADIFRRAVQLPGLARSLTDLGSLACQRNECAAARSYLDEALAIFLALKLKRGIARALEGFAFVGAAQRNYPAVLQLAGAAAALRESVAADDRPAERQRLDAAVADAREHLGDDTASANWTAGWRMNSFEAVAVAHSLR